MVDDPRENQRVAFARRQLVKCGAMLAAAGRI
jgi:hypothetical protein